VTSFVWTSPSVLEAKVRARPGRFSALTVFHSKSVLYGGFLWARRALNGQKRRCSGPAGQVHGVLRANATVDLRRVAQGWAKSRELAQHFP
jgi:hypothetical protein